MTPKTDYDFETCPYPTCLVEVEKYLYVEQCDWPSVCFDFFKDISEPIGICLYVLYKKVQIL